MISAGIRDAVERCITPFHRSQLAALNAKSGGPYVIKFVKSQWAYKYLSRARLKISQTPALTWGTATYVTPLAFPLSSALYGRVGLVTDFDPTNWRIFDATDPVSRLAYVTWVRAQPAFSDLVLTVHSTQANHYLRNRFRKDFAIDCVLFNPDQEAELHTDRGRHVWMAVTDWNPDGSIDSNLSARLQNALFTVLIDEDFLLEENGLPIQSAERQIEKATETIPLQTCLRIDSARVSAMLPLQIIQHYKKPAYLHLYINP